MERHQGVTQQSVEPKLSESVRSFGATQRSTIRLNCNRGMQFLQRYPLIFWSSVWVGVLLTAGLAVSSLMSPSFTNHPAPSPSATPEPAVQADRTPQAGDQTIPIWSLVAISASCAFGCFLISQRLRSQPQAHPRQRTRKPVKRLPPRSTPKLLSTSNAAKASTPRTATSPSKQGKARPAPSQQHTAPAMVIPNPVVTVMPSEQDHPLDWKQPSLADDMDIRRRRPLSHWL